MAANPRAVAQRLRAEIMGGQGDLLTSLYDRGLLSEAQKRAAERYLLMRRAVIGHEHPRALLLIRGAGREIDDEALAKLERAFWRATATVERAGRNCLGALHRCLIDGDSAAARLIGAGIGADDLTALRIGLDELAKAMGLRR